MSARTEDFVPAVVAYHRAKAIGDKQTALASAYKARDCSPCDLEAAIWATNVERLEYQLASPVQRLLWAVFGYRQASKTWRENA